MFFRLQLFTQGVPYYPLLEELNFHNIERFRHEDLNIPLMVCSCSFAYPSFDKFRDFRGFSFPAKG